MHQIVIRQLELFLPLLGLCHRITIGVLAFRIGRWDQPNFAVQYANQIIEVLGTVAVTAGSSPSLRTGGK